LIVRTKPADVAALFLGGIQLVVDLAEDGDEALVVDLLFLGGERLAAAELFEHVVNAGEREAGMLLLLPLAVRIETLAEGADALLEGDCSK
jgi:hypothetical protein